MYLLKYDTHHIRAFVSNQDFIEFSHYVDDLLPLADILFTSSSSLKISSQRLKNSKILLNILQKPPSTLILHYDQTKLQIKFISSERYIEKTISEDRVLHWRNVFQKDVTNFSLNASFNLPHQGPKNILLFLEELGIVIESHLELWEVFYPEDFFFVPFEFENRLLIRHKVPYTDILYRGQECLPIKKVSIMFDPELVLSKEESSYTLKLLEKRSFKLDRENSNILLVSAHGTIHQGLGLLENETLEELIKEQDPEVIVFNSCVLAQETKGILEHFLSKGSKVIASPFYTLCEKTIFSPLLRFLSHTSNDKVWKSFAILKIFYPNIYRYFRYLEPYENNSISQK